MASLTRRLQILLDERQASVLERESRRSGRSVAALIRHAVAVTYGGGTDARRAAMASFLSAPPVEVDDWADEKRAIRDELAGVADADDRPA